MDRTITFSLKFSPTPVPGVLLSVFFVSVALCIVPKRITEGVQYDFLSIATFNTQDEKSYVLFFKSL